MDHIMRIIVVIILVQFVSSCISRNKECFNHAKLNEKELESWLNFDGNVDAISKKKVLFFISDRNNFSSACMIRVNLNFKYVYWGKLSAKKLLAVPLPEKLSENGFYYVAIEIIDKTDKTYYSWSSDDPFYLSTKMVNHITFLCESEDETITLEVHQ